MRKGENLMASLEVGKVCRLRSLGSLWRCVLEKCATRAAYCILGAGGGRERAGGVRTATAVAAGPCI